MKPKFIILSIIVLLIASTGIAVADDTATATPTSSSDTRRSDATPASENESVLLVLDESTRLVSKSYDRETGTLSLVFYSDRYQSVSLVAPRVLLLSSLSTSNLNRKPLSLYKLNPARRSG